jgi:hypothetical protein
MRFVSWVGRVFAAVSEANRGNLGQGPALSAVGVVLGFPGLARDDFVAGTEPARALMTAMTDLAELRLVEFHNVDYGNALTSAGRELLEAGLPGIWPEIFAIRTTEAERMFLARLYAASADDGDGWTDLRFAEADPIFAECGFPIAEYADTIARFTFYGDLEGKGLVRAESKATGGQNTYRPTYLAAVLVSQADPRHGGAQAGLIDWSIATPGFEAIEEHLAELKLRLEGAVSDADLSDVGLRCRRLLVEVLEVVFRPEMVPPGTAQPSAQDADELFGFYLTARLPGKDHAAYRSFLRGAWALASARVHSDRTGRASAVAAAQGALSFVRAIQALGRAPGRRELGDLTRTPEVDS